jgi:hypothetical protein
MQQVINQLEALLDEYTGRLANIPAEGFSLKPSPVKWSKKEILGHLVDSAQNNIQRFVRAQYENKPRIVYNQDVWVAVQGYQNYSAGQLIQLWQLLNRHICIILSQMPQEVYGRLCNTGREEEKLYTVQFLAEDYVTHLVHHLKQIFTN